MSFLEIYLLVVAGVVISIVLPLLRKAILTIKAASLKEWWEKVKIYVIVGVFSLLTALLVVAIAGDTLQDWRAALLAGYAWDSTLQKLST